MDIICALGQEFLLELVFLNLLSVSTKTFDFCKVHTHTHKKTLVMGGINKLSRALWQIVIKLFCGYGGYQYP